MGVACVPFAIWLFVEIAEKLKGDARDEKRLERTMEGFGYRIVHPETLPFSDQIAIFNESPRIVGLVGSAFHTALFSRKGYLGRLAVLTFQPENKRGRYGLIDSIKGYSASYIQCLSRDVAAMTLTIDVDLALSRLGKLEFLS